MCLVWGDGKVTGFVVMSEINCNYVTGRDDPSVNWKRTFTDVNGENRNFKKRIMTLMKWKWQQVLVRCGDKMDHVFKVATHIEGSKIIVKHISRSV